MAGLATPRPGSRVRARGRQLSRPPGSPAPRCGATGEAAGKGGPRRSSPRSWAGRAAPGRRGVRAGLGVRDGAPSPHAGRAAPPLPPGPGATDSAQPRIPARRAGAKADGSSPASPHSRGVVGTPSPTPPQLPGTSPPLPVPGARSPTPPSEARARVTARRANGEAARRGWA